MAMSNSSEALLTDLCAICHTNAIKYTCPRCAIHTCSLPCVKKHKARAQCSGIRNPAEYRRRGDLATDSSIDKDFNFITGVERAITRADDEVLDRKIHLHLAPARQLGLRDARAKVETEIESRGVKVVRAPKGLSRSTNNKTHWANQHKGIMWTVEWMCPGPGGERVVGAALESRSVEEAFVNTVGKKRVRGKRKLSGAESRNAEEEERSKKSVQRVEIHSNAAPKESILLGTAGTVVNNNNEAAVSVPTKNNPVAGLHFYLHKPNTPSKFKCVIPLSSEQTLRSVLEGRTVLEYPTIFIMYEKPEELQRPFITEAEYSSQYGEDVVVNGSSTLEEGEIERPDGAALSSDVNTAKVMEVLAKDLSA